MQTKGLRRLLRGPFVGTLWATVAVAHSPFLLPNHFDLGKRDHVSVQASFTEKFFVPDVVMKADDYHVVMPDGARVPIAPVYTKDGESGARMGSPFCHPWRPASITS